ncbi:hypothetical protein ACWDYH_34645 [Nocardia goodfellowii]|uniref:DUF8176 domain-containing protein n=1 Tax=Nocardia goodfellowii TaxID=882446 RepID=A0ABS4QIZ0_9NOCA|nr:hypothetical protein [Nocardia goodfellowii]MBP2190631.1 hypothetical protein [Nocardia goodfellowii]
MLKSYKELSRWFPALEPETGTQAPASVREDEFRTDDDGPAQYPHYIREPDPDDPEVARARAEVPPDLASRRSEFTGGWSDWVGGHAPSAADDYDRDADLVRFPWPDDDYDDDDEEPVGLRARRSRAGRGRVLAVLVVAVLLLVLAGAGAVWLLKSSGGNDSAGSPRDSLQFTAGSAQSDPAATCPVERTDREVRSSQPGGTGSGPDAILSFQYAYYVERDAERAVQVVAPGASVSPAEVIQKGIETIPAGTTHCVRIVALGDNKYSVEITEQRPGGVPATYNKQTVTTAVIGGRTLITGIAAG